MFSTRARRLTLATAALVLTSCGGGAATPAAPGPAAPSAPTASAEPTPGDAVSSHPAPLGAVSYSDRTDDWPGLYQFHVLYVLHKADERGIRDLDGSIEETVNLMNTWFAVQSGGSTLRFDTYQGRLDITRLVLPGRAEDVLQYLREKYGQQDPEHQGMIFLRNGLEDWINDVDVSRPLLQPGKIYVAYYETPKAYVCADGPVQGSRIVGLYPGAMSVRDQSECAAWLGKNLDGKRGVWEQILAHELIHALGFPGPCASHPVDGGVHIDDPETPNDIMGVRQGPYDREPVLDPNHDDYFGAAVGCPDLTESPFLEPLPEHPSLPEDVLSEWRLP